MAHKTLAGGTAYEIGGGKTLVGGTAYSIEKGKTLVGGTAYGIEFKPKVATIYPTSMISTEHNVYNQPNSWSYEDVTGAIPALDAVTSDDAYILMNKFASGTKSYFSEFEFALPETANKIISVTLYADIYVTNISYYGSYKEGNLTLTPSVRYNGNGIYTISENAVFEASDEASSVTIEGMQTISLSANSIDDLNTLGGINAFRVTVDTETYGYGASSATNAKAGVNQMYMVVEYN